MAGIADTSETPTVLTRNLEEQAQQQWQEKP